MCKYIWEKMGQMDLTDTKEDRFLQNRIQIYINYFSAGIFSKEKQLHTKLKPRMN